MQRRPLPPCAVAAVLALMMLGGCVPSPPHADDGDSLADEIRALTGGECFGSGPDHQLDYDARVPCDKPHTFEVIRSLEVPQDFADAPYADSLDPDSEVGRWIVEYVVPLCIADLADVTDLERVTRLAPALKGAGLLPGISGGVSVHGTPEAEWDEHKLLVCAVSWYDSTGVPIDVASPTDVALVGSFGSVDAVDAMRACLTLVSGEYVQAPCAQPHNAEELFQFDAAMALGEQWATAVDPTAVTEAEQGALDALCGAVGPAVFDAERTVHDVAIVAEVIPSAWGVPAFAGGSFPVQCLAVPTDAAMLLDGPVWGLGDEPATLVPAT